MIVQCDTGLCNRLRVIFSFRKLCDELKVVWVVNQDCNGHFLEHFESVPGVHFVERPSGRVKYKGSRSRGAPDYSPLKLLREPQAQVDQILKQMRPEFSAVHVRRTDHVKLARKRGHYTPDSAFHEFLEQSEEPIYLASDCRQTQERFRRRYGLRIPFETDFEFPNQLRKSSLRQAVIDLFVCVGANRFMGSGWSSFTGVIKKLREERGFRAD